MVLMVWIFELKFVDLSLHVSTRHSNHKRNQHADSGGKIQDAHLMARLGNCPNLKIEEGLDTHDSSCYQVILRLLFSSRNVLSVNQGCKDQVYGIFLTLIVLRRLRWILLVIHGQLSLIQVLSTMILSWTRLPTIWLILIAGSLNLRLIARIIWMYIRRIRLTSKLLWLYLLR